MASSNRAEGAQSMSDAARGRESNSQTYNGPTYRVCGTFSAGSTKAWDPSCDEGIMRPTSQQNVFVARFDRIPRGNYEFKITENGSWEKSYGRDGCSDPGASNMTFNAEQNCSVDIFFDANSRRIDIQPAELRSEQQRDSSTSATSASTSNSDRNSVSDGRSNFTNDRQTESAPADQETTNAAPQEAFVPSQEELCEQLHEQLQDETPPQAATVLGEASIATPSNSLSSLSSSAPNYNNITTTTSNDKNTSSSNSASNLSNTFNASKTSNQFNTSKSPSATTSAGQDTTAASKEAFVPSQEELCEQLHEQLQDETPPQAAAVLGEASIATPSNSLSSLSSSAPNYNNTTTTTSNDKNTSSSNSAPNASNTSMSNNSNDMYNSSSADLTPEQILANGRAALKHVPLPEPEVMQPSQTSRSVKE